MSEKFDEGEVNFEDPFGEFGEGEDPEDLEADDDDSRGDTPRPPDTPTGPPPEPEDAPVARSGAPAEEHERSPEERNWERPEVIEKKGDVEYSNYTIQEAYEAGTLKAGRRYSPGRGSIFSLFGGAQVLTQHQVDRMKHDEAYRQAVFEKGPHGPKGQQ